MGAAVGAGGASARGGGAGTAGRGGQATAGAAGKPSAGGRAGSAGGGGQFAGGTAGKTASGGTAGSAGGGAGQTTGGKAGAVATAGAAGTGGGPTGGSGGLGNSAGSGGKAGAGQAGGGQAGGGQPGSGQAGGGQAGGGQAGAGGVPGTAGQAGAAGDAGAAGQATGGQAGGGRAGSAQGGGSSGEPVVILPKTSLVASELGLLVNDDDPQSVAVAAHYQAARGIPDAHTYHLSLGKQKLDGSLTAVDFEAKVRAPLAGKVDASIQGYAVSFSAPSKVEGMSLTSALALGYDKKYTHMPATGQQCNVTAGSGYYNDSGFAPFTDRKVRPAMILAGATTAEAIALIDRGVASDGTFPLGDGYYVRTTNGPRSARYLDFQATALEWNAPGPLTMTYIDNSKGTGSNWITDKKNVFFYQTGFATIADIATNTYRPGAVADHLTSFGGRFLTLAQQPGQPQMSVLRWLEAGATASYGTAFEPCAYETKFPRASVLVPHYFRGETILEAYWKSVDWPGEGVFVGEPLAKPWGTRTSFDAQTSTLTLVTTIFVPGKTYAIDSAPSASGPWTSVQTGLTVTAETVQTLTVVNAGAAYYRLTGPLRLRRPGGHGPQRSRQRRVASASFPYPKRRASRPRLHRRAAFPRRAPASLPLRTATLASSLSLVARQPQ